MEGGREKKEEEKTVLILWEGEEEKEEEDKQCFICLYLSFVYTYCNAISLSKLNKVPIQIQILFILEIKEDIDKSSN